MALDLLDRETEDDEAQGVECDSCSSMTERESLLTVASGDQVCEDCRDNSYSWCEDCEEYVPQDDIHGVAGGDKYVCGDCLQSSYQRCGGCGEYHDPDDMYDVLDGDDRCDSCRDELSFCEECDGFYHESCGGEHGDVCTCEAPAQNFTIRNDGEAPLANDTRATVTLPAGVISQEGLNAISNYLRRSSPFDYPDGFWNLTHDEQMALPAYKAYLDAHRVAELVEGGVMGDKWQTKDGNFTKRLSRMAWKQYGVKITPEVLSGVGCIARDHSTAVDFALEVTRDLNQSAADFGHEDSCWWQSYSEGRCALKSNGGFGLRTFDSYGEVSGRAWVMPLREVMVETPRPGAIRVETKASSLCRDVCGYADCTLVLPGECSWEDIQGPMPLVPTFEPTHDTETPDAFVVFNGYGDLSGYAPARLMSHMAGMTYRKIEFRCSPMYVNGDSGYLVAPEDIAGRYDDGSLRLSVDQHSDLYSRECASAAA